MRFPRTALGNAIGVLAAIFLLKLTVASAAAAETSEISNGRTSVPLESNGGSFLAKVVLDGSVRGMFIIDTGATHTIISPKIAKKLKLGRDDGRSVEVQVADGDMLNGRVVTIDEISLGRASVYDSRVIILDEFGHTGFDGLLGMSFLGHFTFKIDNDEGKLILYEKD